MSYSCDEIYAVYKETVRRARKAHSCDACKKAIRPGDHYCLVSWVNGGRASSAESVKRCGACQTTHLHLRDVIAGRGLEAEMWPDERLNCGLAYESEWDEEPPADVAALPFISDDERGSLLAKTVSP